MKICFAAIPAFGHTFPMVPLAAAAQAAGHEVMFISGDAFVDRLPVPVVSGVPAGLDLQRAEREAVEVGTDRSDPLWFPRAMFGVVMPRHTAPKVRETWAQHGRPDLLVHEVANLGPAQVAAQQGVATVGFNIAMFAAGWLAMWPPEHGLPAPVVLDPSPPSWTDGAGAEGFERLPIRSVAWSFSGGAGGEWLAGATSGPRGYLTLGTVSFGAVDVLRRSILAAAQVCERVLVAAGPDGDPAALGDLPPSVRVERFVDQAAVLRHADVAIHHGGTGTLLACLAAGVPQVLTPQGADQFVNAERLGQLGLGRVVPNDAAPGALDAALGELLGDEVALTRVSAVRDEIAGMPAPETVLEQLVQRVRRS